ncbi:MAG: hypothetical protein KF724_04015 [Phycisphaeraceae bacterium]|nr:hypothetical protein [Phycisphaeraceae bacterium]
MSSVRHTLRLLTASAILAVTLPAAGQNDERVLARSLSTPFDVIAKENRSYLPLFEAILASTPPPAPVGPLFNPTTVWPGMTGWSRVSEWAKANSALGEALLKAQKGTALAMPYGSLIDSRFVEAGLCVRLGDGRTMGAVEYPYLDRMLMVATYATAEMYRLGEEEKWDQAFDIAIANLRVLRQGADQRTIREKSFFMELLSDCLSVNRDFMWTNLEKIPWQSFQRAGLEGYAALRQADLERLRRLEMPEGDRAIQVAVLRETFGPDGQADPDRFAAIWGPLQARDQPLALFGAAKFWRTVASVHGSIDASEKRLEYIYDDWWRRWRMRPFDPIQELETVLSQTNPTKYAALMLTVTDMKSTFELRQRLMVEINGTALAAGLSGFYRANRTWPATLGMIFPIYAVKRLNYDPFVKRLDARGMPDNGPFLYRTLPRPTKVTTEWGEVNVSDFLLYSIGANLLDNLGVEHTSDGRGGDLVVFPALRALARQQGILD